MFALIAGFKDNTLGPTPLIGLFSSYELAKEALNEQIAKESIYSKYRIVFMPVDFNGWITFEEEYVLRKGEWVGGMQYHNFFNNPNPFTDRSDVKEA